MAISPNQEEKLAAEVRRIYEDAEIQLLQMIAKRLAKHGEMAEWQSIKLAQLSDLLRDAQKVVGRLNREIPKLIYKIIELAYLAGDQSAIDDLKRALQTIQDRGESVADYKQIQLALFPDFEKPEIDIDATMATFSGINTSAIEALAGATTQTLISVHVPIVRAVEDIYRSVITEVAGSTLTGVETRLEVAQRALNRFIERGIKVFRDSAGRNWEIATYAEMATRTAIGQASLAGHINKMVDMGFDLVQVSDHHEECDLCRKWEGKILSVTGKTAGYKTLAEARNAGLFHPNCGHRLYTYFEGLTEPITGTADPEGYKERQTQRYLERQIRHWKRRVAAAITDDERRKAQAKLSEWQAKMREFIDETGRRRKYERESITRAR